MTLVYSQLEISVYTTGFGDSLVYRQLEISVYTTGTGDSLVYRQLEISVYTTSTGGSYIASLKYQCTRRRMDVHRQHEQLTLRMCLWWS